ncbi:Gfo/Idh/MocA family protein [Halorussus salinisoli]|uniref:Gfo/Idh/MocA family protein n=1 Tax=Halorussus salinisoli TaxID=2558242 RepID=UPI0010C1E96C|nr:Gfo/Idh/MocA family oxidoreductase [Halorussus salinisoli]
MTEFDVAVIGTGPEPDNPVWGESAAMAYRHGKAYRRLDTSQIVACADIVRENAEAFADEFDVSNWNVFEDYEEMLHTVEPDVVSVCTPVPTHADIVVDVIETGIPGAIHCEKPMADTWSDSLRMFEVAEEYDVQLTFNHQRRFGPPWRRAKELLDAGTVGDLKRVEMGRKNLFDYGTHLIDLCHYFNDERSAEWVLSQVHYTEEDVRYGTHNENQAVAIWEYDNGVKGFAATGKDIGSQFVPCENRVVGDEGVIEVHPDEADADLRYRGPNTDGWVEENFEVEETLITLTIEHVLQAYANGEDPEIDATAALRATELIFAAWESARQRERIELPIDIDGNALKEMVESGKLTPESDEK